MYLLYSLLLTVGFLILLPKFVIDALRTRKYVTGLSQRLGKLPVVIPDDKPVIWIHCVSVGETEAARPLVKVLLDRFPSHCLVVSTTTVTGQKVARNAFGNQAAAIFYFPIDWAWTVRRVLRVLRPAAVLIMETELWPHLLRECRARAIPVALINGRISETSFRRYKLIHAFMSRVLNDLSVALMQSERDAERIRELGLASERTLVAGNVKFDSAEAATDQAVAVGLSKRFRLEADAPFIVAGSTHPPEETVVIEAFKQLRNVQPRARLLIAPRHPARFDEVAALLDKSGLHWASRSSGQDSNDALCDVVLLDTVGELRAVYALATVAFVGGSIAPHGGHNLLEPAALGIAVVTGPHTENFTAITRVLVDQDAVVQLPDAQTSEMTTALAAILGELLADERRRRDMGRRALTVCNQNRGATERTLQVLESLLTDTAASDEALPFPAFHTTTAK